MPKEVGQDYKKSTWREQTVTLQVGDVTPVYFDDTKPNHAAIVNNTNQNLYVHTSPSVGPNNHLLAIAAGQTKVFARPLGYTIMYLYAAVNSPASVRIESWEEKFTVNSIPQSMDIIQMGEVTGNMDIRSLPPLPQGSNVIGKVGIDGGVTLEGTSIPQTQPVPIREAGLNDFKVGGCVVGLTSVPARAGANMFPNRREVTIYPPDTGKIFWGKAGVTPATGAPLTSNDSPLTFKVHDKSPEIYLVAENEVNVVVVEVS